MIWYKQVKALWPCWFNCATDFPNGYACKHGSPPPSWQDQGSSSLVVVCCCNDNNCGSMNCDSAWIYHGIVIVVIIEKGIEEIPVLPDLLLLVLCDSIAPADSIMMLVMQKTLGAVLGLSSCCGGGVVVRCSHCCASCASCETRMSKLAACCENLGKLLSILVSDSAKLYAGVISTLIGLCIAFTVFWWQMAGSQFRDPTWAQFWNVENRNKG
jgi:hypothetical protein